jgi:hypothetical protein
MDCNSVPIRCVGAGPAEVSSLQAHSGRAISVGQKFDVVAAVSAPPFSDDSVLRCLLDTGEAATVLTDEEDSEKQATCVSSRQNRVPRQTVKEAISVAPVILLAMWRSPLVRYSA